MSRYKKLASLAVGILLLFSSCGRNRSDSANEGESASSSGTYQDTYGMPTQTLRILIPDLFLDFIFMGNTFARAEESMNRMMAESGQRFKLDITTLPSHDLHKRDSFVAGMRQDVMMMAGDFYDLFWVDFDIHNIWRYSQAGFLTDIYTLMDESPNTSRDDFFTNVLDAHTISGGLYVFPLTFSFQYFGINAMLPQRLIDAFAEKDTISHVELMSMYLDLQYMYLDDFGHLQMSCNMYGDTLPVGMIRRQISDFIDLNTRVSRLNDNGFIDSLEYIQRVQEAGGFGQVNFFRYSFPPRRRRRHESAHFAFISDTFGIHPFFAFFQPNQHQYFLQHIPTVNHEGALQLSRRETSCTFAFFAGGDGALAWEFLQHLTLMMTADNPVFANMRFAIPIKPRYFHTHFTALFNKYADFLSSNFQGMEYWSIERENNIRQAMERLWDLAHMPIAPISMVHIGMFEEDIDQLMRGLITPRDAAVRMHNRMTLWLIE